MRPAARTEARRARGAAGRKRGRRHELLAALWLMAKGYRILGFRLRTPQGEVDLLAVRGRILAVVEVKCRTTIIEALEAVSPTQRDRLRRAGAALAAHRPSLRRLTLRLDLIVFPRDGSPRHVRNAWSGAP